MKWEWFLGIAVSALSVINGLMLLRNYLRDRPILKVDPIHPDTYQWFFSLPNGIYQGRPTRKFGFLAYVGIINKGVRDVSLNSWRLNLKIIGGKKFEFKPMSIPEPQIQLGQSDYLKAWPVLGQKGVFFPGDTMVKSGSSIAGFAYYIAEFYGEDSWNLLIKNGKVTGYFVVKGVYGRKATAKIIFNEIPLEQAKKMIPNVDKIDAKAGDP